MSYEPPTANQKMSGFEDWELGALQHHSQATEEAQADRAESKTSLASITILDKLRRIVEEKATAFRAKHGRFPPSQLVIHGD